MAKMAYHSENFVITIALKCSHLRKKHFQSDIQIKLNSVVSSFVSSQGRC